MFTKSIVLLLAVAVVSTLPQYLLSGWRPSGPQFSLPQRFVAPSQQYGTPSQEYGPPQGTTTTEAEVTTTELPETTTENVDLEGDELEGDKTDAGAETFDEEEGVYYIYHPSGVLQRVVYATKDDVAKMEFSAKLKYENVQPIKEPIYTYDPKTLVLNKL